MPGLESLAGPTARFIATARNALPGLLAELKRTRTLVAERDAALARVEGLRGRAETGERHARMALREAVNLLTRRRKAGPRTMAQILRILAEPLEAPSVVSAQGLTVEQREHALERLTTAHPGTIFTFDNKAETLSAPGCVPEDELRMEVRRAAVFARGTLAGEKDMDHE